MGTQVLPSVGRVFIDACKRCGDIVNAETIPTKIIDENSGIEALICRIPNVEIKVEDLCSGNGNSCGEPGSGTAACVRIRVITAREGRACEGVEICEAP